MDTLNMVWTMIGGLLCLALVLVILLWVQCVHSLQYKAELRVTRDRLQSLAAKINRLEGEKAELAAGLRAEKGQVEHLKRQIR
jgi:hypothetical protein